MFGKFLSRFLVSGIVLFFSTIVHTNTNTYLMINGFQTDKTNQSLTKGMRYQGIGDFFFNKNSYAQAVPYYEKALALLPKEADITFKLAAIYQSQKLWRLSILYYENTIELLKDPLNFGKSQLNSYISRIRIAYIYHLQGDSDKSRELLALIREEVSIIQSLYPKAWEELQAFDMIYPETAVRRPPLTN